MILASVLTAGIVLASIAYFSNDLVLGFIALTIELSCAIYTVVKIGK